MLHFAVAGPLRPRATRRRPATAALGLSLALAGLFAGSAAHATEPGQGRVVVVGVAGLRWTDVNEAATPALWELQQHGAIGTLTARSVRSSACPADGWLALSAGARAADLSAPASGECRALTDPATGGPVPGWPDYLAAVRQDKYDARLGTLGNALRTTGISASSFGPGAAIALADPAGTVVSSHQPVPTDPTVLHDQLAVAMSSSRLVVIDGGVVRDPGRSLVPRTTGSGAAEPSPTVGASPTAAAAATVGEQPRAGQVAVIESRVAAVLAAIDEERARSGADPTFLLVSLADSGTTPRMQLAVALGPGVGTGEPRFENALLGTNSTRQPGMLQVTDVAPTIIAALGLPQTADQGAFVGSPIRVVGDGGSATTRVRLVVDIDRHSAAVRSLVEPFFGWLFAINLVLSALVVIGLSRRSQERVRAAPTLLAQGNRATRPAAPDARLTGALGGLRTAGVALAAIPVASLLANAVPWWRAARPGLALVALILVGVAVVSAVALVPRWRRWPLGPLGVVAAITTAVIAADVATGARLQLSAVMGVQPLVAGRFYGFNNTAFALFAACSLLLAAAIADPLVRRGRRGQAAAIVGGIGLVATVLDGAPGIGSDFGGPTALFSGFALLALLAAGVRLTWRRVLGVLLAGVAIVAAFAVADWLRPVADRTHLGRFVQTALDGGLWPVVQRKLGQNLGTLFGNWLAVLALGSALLVAFGLWRLLRRAANAAGGGPFGWLSGGDSLGSIGTDVPLLRPVVLALAVALGIGFLVNDSGIAIPAIGVSVALPLLIATCASWLLARRSLKL